MGGSLGYNRILLVLPGHRRLSMQKHVGKIIRCLVVLASFLLFSQQAMAFRCGSKLVIDGMLEQTVRHICGEPVSVRHLGYVVRPYFISSRRQTLGGLSVDRNQRYRHLNQEVLVTEYVYNFGPRKLMRRLVFEGGILVTIETLSYGYLEEKQ
jgi:hypothetical protein